MTIYALSTGPGISGIAVVRVSGAETSKVIKLLTNKELPRAREATLRKVNKINTNELMMTGLIPCGFLALRATQARIWLNSMYMVAKQ